MLSNDAQRRKISKNAVEDFMVNAKIRIIGIPRASEDLDRLPHFLPLPWTKSLIVPVKIDPETIAAVEHCLHLVRNLSANEEECG
jgi:hypothetical protein